MFGRKSDGRCRFKGVKLALGILAVIGAVGIVKGGKRWMKEKCAKACGVMRFGSSADGGCTGE